MTASPSVASLQSLLRADSTSPAPSSSSASSSTLHAPSSASTSRPSSTAQAFRGYTSPGYWGSTWTGAFGFGQDATPSNGSGLDSHDVVTDAKAKGKARAGIPSWPSEAEETESVKAQQDERAESGAIEGRRDEVDRELDHLADSILWQAGVDDAPSPAQGGPLVLACSKIPGPSTALSHAKLLEKLRDRFETFAATGSYAVVLLVNPTPYPPTTPQLVSSYLSLSRTTRKNLRKLWVVGGGWWTRIILTLFNTTLLSLKTARKGKVVQCADLSSLAEEMGAQAFSSVEFPLEVYVENAKVEKEIRLPESDLPRRGVFGVPLDELCGSDGTSLPPILRDCLEVLEAEGPTSLGIFRRSPSASTVKILEGAYSRSHPVSLSTYPDSPYLAASLLKLFLRELPEPILGRPVWERSKDCPVVDPSATRSATRTEPDGPLEPSGSSTTVSFIRQEILPLVSNRSNLVVLTRVVRVLHLISLRSSENLMTSSNLVICLCPALIGGVGGMQSQGIEACRVPGMETMRGGGPFGSADQDSPTKAGRNTVGGVLKVMIERFDEVFDSTA
ncbi:hypothetical protein JCM10212_002580 [Sporobolomyces blumeae]